MKRTKLLLCVIAVVTIFIFNSAYTQQQNSVNKHLSNEDSVAVNALVMYPDTIRLDIFEVCVYPAAIVNIASLQKKSSNDFSNLISGFPKEEQEDYWNLSRYPGLISKLAQGNKKSAEQINSILTSYPNDIHDKTLKYGTDHYDELQKMDALQTSANSQFEQIISDYPQVTQDAWRELILYPEIISLLNEHLNLAVRAGDHYRRDPQGVIHRADSINLAETKQNTEDAAVWKEEIQKNPEEANDLKNAADDYAKENGYTRDEINAAPNPEYVNHYTVYPYSYWFGYPVWYPYQYWYPYPFWFDCGFYYDSFGSMVIIGYPSFYFTNWYFYYPHHWHQYPHLCNSYINHYYGPRRFASSNSSVVHGWVRDNRNYLPPDFVNNHSKRVEVIKQVGQLNMDVQKQQPGKTVSPAVRNQYFQNNTSKYPSLNANQQEKMQMEEKQQNVPDMRQQPVKQPPGNITRPEQQNVPTPRQQTKTPAYDFDKINRAQDYHKNSWEQSQPISRPQMQQPQRSFQQPSRGGGGRRK